ncbi:MAG: YqiA/YcfP family alpha/beta fold hydrolase [Pseudomonadota bacterium]
MDESNADRSILDLSVYSNAGLGAIEWASTLRWNTWGCSYFLFSLKVFAKIQQETYRPKMDKLIIYFHGYGSSKESSKVQWLNKASNSRCIAFDIDIDPTISIPKLTHDITMEILDEPNLDEELIFVGTSLGGWYAAKLASIFKCGSVIINPTINPKTSLLKYGVSSQICNNYSDFEFNEDATYFISLDDEVIDHSGLLLTLENRKSKLFKSYGGHRFHENFTLVVDYLSQN